jgi:ADP-heptose:LPS heptosyltransferase
LLWGFGVDTPVNPQARDLGTYGINCDDRRDPGIPVCDGDYSIFSPRSFDYVFIGWRFGDLDEGQRNGLVNQLVSKLKVGGHLLIHCPEELVTLIERWGLWTQKAWYHESAAQLRILKFVDPTKQGIRYYTKPSQPTACIARYGAIGDMIMVTPLIRKLHEDGFHVTLNVSPYCADVIKCNPYVDNLVLQDREAIPNAELGPYWDTWRKDYDRYINLSESIEGGLLKLEGRQDFYTPKTWRVGRVGHINYVQRTMEIGGYGSETLKSEDLRAELFFSATEERTLRKFRRNYEGKFLVVWAANGTSWHKQYPYMGEVIKKLLGGREDIVVVVVGGKEAKPLGFEHERLVWTCGLIPLREALGLTKIANLVIGPETAITNAASCYPTPKVVFLSHSSVESLTRDWENCVALLPNVPCYPCHQLHYQLESCPLDKETKLPVCASAVKPETVLDVINSIYLRRKGESGSSSPFPSPASLGQEASKCGILL